MSPHDDARETRNELNEENTQKTRDSVLPLVEGEPFRSIEQALRAVAEQMTVAYSVPDGLTHPSASPSEGRKAWWRARRRPRRGEIMPLH